MKNIQIKIKKNVVVPTSGARLRVNIDKIFTELFFKMKKEGLSEKIVKIVNDNRGETLSIFLSDHDDVKVTSEGLLYENGVMEQPEIIANYIYHKLFGDIKMNR